jgi:hypothetical protein
MAFPVAPTNGQTAVVNNITYQFSNVGNTWTRILSTANIITANTLVSNGYISAAGNVSGNYVLGNGSQLTGIAGGTPTLIANGTSNVNIATLNGNVTVGVNGTSNVVVFAATGGYITGVVSASGNITGSSHLGAVVSVTGNVIGGNILTAGAISATGTLSVTGATTLGTASTGNLSAGNILTGGLVSATANVVGGNILTAGVVSASGNVVSAGNIIASKIVSATDNIIINSSGGEGGQIVMGWVGINNITGQTNSTWNFDVDGTNNLRAFYQNAAGATSVLLSASPSSNILSFPSTAGISVSGNVNAGTNYFIGNGSQLTGIATGTPTQIVSGTSNVSVVSSGGNVSVGVGGTANVAVFATTGEYITGVLSATGNITGGNVLTAGIMSSTGNAIHSNVLTGGLISATGNITGGNLTVSTGTITVGNIVNANGNAVGNIGSSSAYFNTIFGKATTAQYADLAELYIADTDYAPGTVVDFGGTHEITLSTQSSSARIAGVVSTNPAHLMNSTLTGEHVTAVALTGRVPAKVIGTVRKGDMMVSAGNGHAQASAAPTMGTVIGKALENFDGVSGMIEVVVGRL